MLREMMKSKIHRATVTGADINYIGSITIDSVLMEAADLLPNEKVQVANNNNGSRFETYVIEGEKNSGTICINGAAARLVQPGDEIIIISYALIDAREIQNFTPKIIFVDRKNRIKHDVKV